MKSAGRIYTVTGGSKDRLVRATRPTVALSHVARTAFDVRVATQNDLEQLIAAGVKVEDATAEPPAAATQDT